MTLQYLDGNRLTLLTGGSEYFPALLEAIAGARDEIHLETYLFADDQTGRTVAAALCAAAGRGVLVRVLVDGFGGGDFGQRLLPQLRAGGVQAMLYRPDIRPFALRRNRLRRLHRKLAIVDGATAFIGGINVINDAAPGLDRPRLDYAVLVRGPLLEPIHEAARRMWEVVCWANFHRRYRLPPDRARGRADGTGGPATAALVLRDNVRRRRDIEEAYLAAIGEARSEILIANAYFLPGRRFRKALLDAAARGVAVTLLLQGRVEYRLQHWATQALYGPLIGGGIRIFEYRRSYLHAKVAVIDRRWATVGSSNIDPISLLVAKEANLVSIDPGFAEALRASLMQAISAGAVAVAWSRWRQFSILQRALRWISYQLIRLAVGLTGYRRPGEE